jgi:hypothetical protein
MGSSMNFASAADVMKEIKAVVPLYAGLEPGSLWRKEQSPLADTIADLSLTSDTIMKNEVITSDRLLFSSGMTITRSREIACLRQIKVEA